MERHFLPIMTGYSLPRIRQLLEADPSIINNKTIGDFTRVVEQTDILRPELVHLTKEQG
jgi:hypothetical protein